MARHFMLSLALLIAFGVSLAGLSYDGSPKPSGSASGNEPPTVGLIAFGVSLAELSYDGSPKPSGSASGMGASPCR